MISIVLILYLLIVNLLPFFPLSRLLKFYYYIIIVMRWNNLLFRILFRGYKLWRLKKVLPQPSMVSARKKTNDPSREQLPKTPCVWRWWYPFRMLQSAVFCISRLWLWTYSENASITIKVWFVQKEVSILNAKMYLQLKGDIY